MVVGSFYRLSAFASSYPSVRVYCHKAKMTSLLVPLASMRGMTSLDRSAFTRNVQIPYLMFRDIPISKVVPLLKKYLLKVKNFKPVQPKNNGTIIYLHPALIRDVDDIDEKDQEQLQGKYDHFGKANITLTYENWSPKEILRAILPEDVDVPMSYSTIGHIIHFNLNEEQLPYKTIVGQVYLDHLKNVKTVVNKSNIINTVFRHFPMEVLAGEKDTVVTVKENGYTYMFDFAQVYWNPRLSTEHQKLVKTLKTGDTLYDVFAGVGPFAIPACSKGINVLANDLNPESFKWLEKNATLNKMKGDFQAFNLDGRYFLRNIVKPDILSRRNKNSLGSEHIVMNLPALAIEFLDVISGWFTEDEAAKVCSRAPMLHVYCFIKVSKESDPCHQAKCLVEQKLGHPLGVDESVGLHYVRNVAPNKEMIRVSFLLTLNILQNEEPATKRLKVERNNYVTNTLLENNGKEQEFSEKSKDEECVQSDNST